MPEVELDIDRIVPNPRQPRSKLNDEGIEQLAASIREHGVLQPVLVRPWQGRYQLVAGERRVVAAQRAGLLKIPARVREIPEERLLEFALIENIQREQLNPIEEAQAYQQLLDSLQTTQEELAGRLAKERSTVANAIRLLKLPQSVKQMVADGKISPGHARALLASEVPAQEMAKVASLIIQQGWSVRDAERWAKKRTAPHLEPKPQDPNEAAAADRLRVLLGTKVEIVTRNNRKRAGQIRIHFFSQEDLIRIYSIIVEKRH